MKQIYCLLLTFVATFLLTSCASSPEDRIAKTSATITPAAGGPLLPLPGESPVNDPDDGLFMDVLSGWLEKNKAPANTQYEFTRIDLDGDGRREGLVLMQSPHQSWCMEYGCTLFLFRAHDEGFSYLSEISPVRGPLVVAENRTSGWRDLIVHVSGYQSLDARNVALQFNGRTYPAQPASAPVVSVNMLDVGGVKIFP
ncbi:MAG: hypothetical protein NDJ24_04950 [Alphaproteobacteria bacterium]|nr:hypothetical protein [Alphaproteobacteria bacterium]